MSTKKVTPSKEQKKVEVVKPEPVKKTIKSFQVGEYEATRFVWKDDGKLKREYKKVCLSTHEDISNKPARKNEILNESMEKSWKDGWYFDDDSAIEEALKMIEGDISQGAVDIEYNGMNCKCCISKRLRNLAESMRMLRWIKDKRRSIFSKVDDEELDSLPSVLTDLDTIDEWGIVKGRWQRKRPEVEVESFELTKEQSNAIRSVLEKITGEKIGGKGELVQIK